MRHRSDRADGRRLQDGPLELSDWWESTSASSSSSRFGSQSFHEPRWQRVGSRRHGPGRALGRRAPRLLRVHGGDASRGGPNLPAERAWWSPSPRGLFADEIRELAERSGTSSIDSRSWTARRPSSSSTPRWAAQPRARGAVATAGATPLHPVCDGSLAELDPYGGAVGFHVLPPLAESCWSSDALLRHSRGVRDRAEASFGRWASTSNGWGTLLGSCSGGRLPAGASFASRCRRVSAPQRTSTPPSGSASTTRGVRWSGGRHRAGPRSHHLDALHAELHEERYRASPLLRRMVAEGKLGRSVGEGFFSYD